LLKKEGYAYDFFRCISDFPINLRCNYLWGDVTHVPNEPTFVKSRPICINNDNSVLLPLDTRRHLFFPDDLIDYDDKKNFAVWRGSAFQDQRQLFLKALKTLKFCDVSHYSSKGNFKDMTSNYMSIQNQLKNKIIFSIEGNDVATNLKWIMGSNSLCFSPKLRFETWFREGQLIPFVHYVQINNDFSDVEDKFNYYISHPNEAKAIIKNAQAHAKLFYDINTQYKIAALVALKYFKSTLQIIK
jgi:hypothetical protein